MTHDEAQKRARIIKYRVMSLIFNNPTQAFVCKMIASFSSYEAAENYILECDYPSELQIQKVYIL